MIVAAGFLVIAVVLTGAIYVNRMRVATFVVQRYLASHGIESEIAFRRIGWGGFLARVRSGPVNAPDFSAEGVDVTLVYPHAGLVGRITPEIATIRLLHPIIRVGFDGAKISFGSLQSLIDDALAMDSAAPKPAVAIEGGRLLLTTPAGVVGVIADATIAKGKLIRLKGSMAKTTLRANAFAGEISEGTIAADFSGDALNVSATLKSENLIFDGRSVRGLDTAANIRGLKWTADGNSYRFTMAGAAVTVDAGAAQIPDVAAAAAKIRLDLDAVTGDLIDGRLRASTRGQLTSALTQMRFGEASMASLDAQSAFSSFVIDTSRTAWSVGSDAHIVLHGTGATYPMFDGGSSLASLDAVFDQSGTVKSDGANGTIRGTISAGRGLSRSVALRSLKVDFDGDGAIGGAASSAMLRASLSASGNVPRSAARDLAHRIPAIGADEAIVSSIAGALQAATLRIPDVRLVRSGNDITLSARGPIIVNGMNGARFALSPQGNRPLAAIHNEETSGAMALELRGGGLPQFRLAVPAYRYRRASDRALVDAETQFETSLDFGALHGVHVRGAAKLQVAGNRIEVAAPACTDISMASFGKNGIDRIRNAKARLCGTALRVADNRVAFDLPGCADVSFDSFLNNETGLIGDAKGKLCGAAGIPLFTSEPAGWRFQGRWAETSARLVLAQSAIADSSGQVQLAGKDAQITSGSVTADQMRLSDLLPQPRFMRVSASGTMAAAGPNWQGQFRLASSGKPIASVAVQHALNTGAGDAAIDARDLAFEPGALQPANLLPFLASFGTRVQGHANFAGHFAWSKDGLTSDGRLSFSDIDFQSRAGMVHRARAELAFGSLIPIALQPNQTVTAERVDFFVPLEQVSARFSYTPSDLQLQTATAAVAGGKISLDPLVFRFAPGSTTAGLLRLENVDIAPLIDAAGLAGRVSAVAHIGGTVPFTFGPEGVRFVNGQIAANGPGHLSIKREALTTSVGVAEGGQAPPNAVQDFAYQALENLAFEQLDGTVNSRPMGRLGVLFHIKGRNDPAQASEPRIAVLDLLRGSAFDKPLPLPKGTPIDLTLDTSLNLDELLNSYFNTARNDAAAETSN